MAAVVVAGPAYQARAEDDAKALILKAIKAHGVKEGDGKKAVQTKTKGKLELMGGIEFTQEVSAQPPDKFKDVMDLQLMGMKITQTTVFDGKQLWVSAMGQTVELKDKYLEAVKDAMALSKILQLTFLQDKGIKLESLGEVNVENKPALGVRISKKGLKDVNLYIDKKSGLVVKVERRTVDPMSGNEITEERIVTEYQDLNGRKVAKKLIVNRDGKKLMEAEVTDLKFVDKIDDSEFAKP
jgi:hypothetical protein